MGNDRQCVAVLGDGGWGTALAMVLVANGHEVRVWGPFPEYLADVRAQGTNPKYLPDVELPADIDWVDDRDAAVAGADLVLVAIPTKYFRPTLERFRGRIRAATPLVTVAKGLDSGTNERMSQVAAEVLGVKHVCAVSGPSHAEEVARRIPTAVTAAALDGSVVTYVQQLLSNDRFRVYTSADIVGVELGGALKNVIAISVGVSDGLGFGDNTRAALITRGLAEISRLGAAMGARASTFAGLSGMGDLIVTCTSRLSRNRGIGERIGRGERVEDILASTELAAEGVWNCASARALAHSVGVEVPITEQVYAMVHEARDPAQSVSALMQRDLKSETA